MFEAMRVKCDHSTASHIKCYDSTWVLYYAVPQICIVIVSVLNNDNGVRSNRLKDLLVMDAGSIASFFNDNDVVVTVVVANTIQLLL